MTSALEGLKVIDISTLFAGPLAATMLGDFGAEVIKVEHPRFGDPSRGHGAAKDGIGLWWKSLSRNKKAVTCYLGAAEGRDLFLRLVRDADVIIENFRPGTLERWGLGPDVLHDINPGLVLARVTGFGQIGPMAHQAGFGTLAESMSGFAAITGEADGPPTLPPFGLADGITALTTAFAILTALRAREATGVGQVIDLAIIEPILTILGPQPIAFDQLGLVQERTGNRSVNNAPRNTYQTADAKWVAVSTSSQSIAERVMQLVGRPELIQEPWFQSGRERAQHAEELDAAVGTWIGQRNAIDVLAAFQEADAAIAPVYDIADVMRDPQYEALGSIVAVPDGDFGSVRMQNVLFRLSETPGQIHWTGPAKGEHNAEIYGAHGVDGAELAQLAEKGIV